MLEQGVLKYGDLLEGSKENSEESESSSSDDSEAELINAKSEAKFLSVITAIRENDPSILTKTGDNSIGVSIWKDEDFDDSSDEDRVKPKKVKKFTLKDQERTEALRKIEEGASASDSESDSGKIFKKRGKTIADEERQLKQEFKSKAEASDSGDDFLVQKKGAH